MSTDKFNSVIQELSLSRVRTHTINRNIGIITAYRSRPEIPFNENNAINVTNNRKLRDEIRSLGYGYIGVTGRYIENYGTDDATPVDEWSWIMIAPLDDTTTLKSDIQKLGTKYKQESIIYKPKDDPKAYLIGTNPTPAEGFWLNHKQEVPVGEFKANRTGEFHSILRKAKDHPLRRSDDKRPLAKSNASFAFEESFAPIFESGYSFSNRPKPKN